MRYLRLSLLLALPLVFSACDSAGTDVDNVRRAFVERIELNDFPYTQSNGEGWDGGGANQADVYFLLLGVNNNDIVINGEEDGVNAVNDDTPADGIYGNVEEADGSLVFTLNNPVVAESEITVLDRTLRLQVKDDDTNEFNPDDVMVTSQAFNLYAQLPATLPASRRVVFPVTSDDGTLSAQITVRYER